MVESRSLNWPLVRDINVMFSTFLQMYARVTNRLKTARDRVRDIKVSLSACKELLHYKRDDLKRLWLEGVQQKHMLELMEGVQLIKKTPDRFDSHLAEQDHLAATHLLVEAVSRINGDLRDIGGLNEIRTLIEKRKEKLYTHLMENLCWLLYHGLESGEDGAGGMAIGGGAGSNVGSGRRNNRDNNSGRGGRGSGRNSGRGAPPPGTTLSQQHLLRTLQNRNLEVREKT